MRIDKTILPANVEAAQNPPGAYQIWLEFPFRIVEGAIPGVDGGGDGILNRAGELLEAPSFDRKSGVSSRMNIESLSGTETR